MTATERLRALLDERGAEWWEEDGHTLWYGESTHHAASAFSSFLFGENERVHLNAMVTPAQAIAATLGNEDTYTREDVEGAFVSGYSLGCLPVGSDPQWDENRQTVDEYMADWGWVRKESATLGTGTCHLVRERVGKSGKAYRMVCSECHHVIYDGWQEKPRYCAFCGARVEDE